ncbi:protein-glutamate O-methyltransferase CheR [Clostridium tertium]|jgi:chemotaxis protein methyltransferase CheR|nr:MULTISPECIES: protein-glutamate O-methyltransferase CheR [Clostridium]MBS5307407.1 protein-glutamate O-methyltransferase CheR [Clostridium sp.]MDB1922493.1 protein-glutamate O-methyltransferase CheR [Clostridium tertium]MDB1926290.1 protein-glutamate O-methyltransferase CheR [Clostridium tertium]MDB1928850.1 protein-glutamate O-methyltransferase CheR [Clostridium tertium]MDB1943038.1 protein-glutamate O-methyltransferase CheR [Clostridium tertium]
MDFTEFHNWIYREFNINLNAYKQEQLNRRIGSLMSRIDIKSLEDYKKLLRSDNKERQRFLDFITINVTEFFRNPELFKELEKALKSYLLNNNKLKIWSAACSIGCEPYSIAMMLNEINPMGRNNIVATDIDSTILKRASLGEYVQAEMKNIDEDYRKKYFKLEKDKYIINNNIKSMVTFKKHDLILDNYEKDFDLIVCRNVIIYFKNDVKKEIFKNFSNSLKKGGLLFVGATESIYNYKEYGLEKVSTFIYKRV